MTSPEHGTTNCSTTVPTATTALVEACTIAGSAAGGKRQFVGVRQSLGLPDACDPVKRLSDDRDGGWESTELISPRALSSLSGGSTNYAEAAAAGYNGMCSVCGDCAVGCNFDAITCGSCKAFFRRNGIKGKALSCMFSGDCQVNVKTRRFCSACRLRKCFAMGMKTDMILDDKEKRDRKEKAAINRERRLQKLQMVEQTTWARASQRADSDLPPGLRSARASEIALPNDVSDSRSQQTMDTSTQNEAVGCDMIFSAKVRRRDALSFECHPLTQPESGVCCSSAVDTSDAAEGMPHHLLVIRPSVVDGAADRGYIVASAAVVHQAASPNPGAPCAGLQTSVECFDVLFKRLPSARRRLSTREEEEITAIEKNYRSTMGQNFSNMWDGLTASSSLAMLINTSTVLAVRLVTFAKSMQGFMAASRDVQVALLKAGAIPCMVIRGAQLYDASSRCWVDSVGKTLPSDIADRILMRINPNFGHRHANLVSSLRRLLPTTAEGSCDSAVLALLHSIMLLSPEQVLVACSEEKLAALADTQQHYIVLLGRYLEAAYSYAVSAELLPGLLQHLTMCKHHGRQLQALAMLGDTSHVDPLLKEVYDLNCPSADAASTRL